MPGGVFLVCRFKRRWDLGRYTVGNMTEPEWSAKCNDGEYMMFRGDIKPKDGNTSHMQLQATLHSYMPYMHEMLQYFRYEDWAVNVQFGGGLDKDDNLTPNSLFNNAEFRAAMNSMAAREELLMKGAIMGVKEPSGPKTRRELKAKYSSAPPCSGEDLALAQSLKASAVVIPKPQSHKSHLCAIL